MIDPSIVLVIDTETTGTDTSKDRIVEFAVQNGIDGDVSVELFNPGVPIPKEATEVHGITNADVRDKPRFPAHVYAELVSSARVVIGYNVKFDLAMLLRECELAGVDLILRRYPLIVDPLRLWQHYEPRTLAAAVGRFTDMNNFDAHSAEADVRATGAVTMGILDHFDSDADSWAELADLCYPEREMWVGPSGDIVWSDGKPTFSFGKHAGRAVADVDASYLEWVVTKSSLPKHVRDICQVCLGRRDQFVERVAKRFGVPRTALEKGAPRET